MVREVQDQRFLRSFAQALPDFLRRQRWFGGKAKPITGCEVVDVIPLRNGPDALYFFLVRVDFAGVNPQTYALPLQWFANASQAEAASIAGFTLEVESDGAGGGETITFGDAARQRDFPGVLLDVIGRGDKFQGMSGELVGVPTGAFQNLRGPEPHLDASILSVEQSNTSIVYGKRVILKVFRLVEPGVNSEIEICSFLTERTSFANFAAVAGTLAYRQAEAPRMSLAVLQAFVPNQGDAWKFTLGALGAYFDRVAGQAASGAMPRPELSQDATPAVAERIGSYLESADLLGRRTAELHAALASDVTDSDFAPEPFTPEYQRSLYASMLGLVQHNLGLLRDRSQDLTGQDRELARLVLGRENELRAGLSKILDRRMTSLRIRVHGDYHLGQVLYTGSDFVIIDFEGEPARPLHERRLKLSPLKDVAGMLRSFHYAAHSGVLECAGGGEKEATQNRDFDAWARYWQTHVSGAFLRSYLKSAAGAAFMPNDPEELRLLLDVSILEKAIYELGYELNNRPSWVGIPLEGILETLGHQTQVTGA
ncbi:MAG TPA: putative maltokinase [Terriglobia bacterium]|nr:putative maltokinase [Terriglobia bacterium]